MSKQTLILDSSQLSTLLECEERWRLEQQEHLIHINEKNPAESNRPNEDIAAGSLGHKYQEIYYYELAMTQNPAAAMNRTLLFDPDAVDFVDEHQFPLAPETRAAVRKRFVDYIMTYTARDYTVAMRSEAAIGLDENDCLVDTKRYIPLVEQGFSYKLFESPEYLFILEGRIDLICESRGYNLWMDHKWQFRERELYKKSIQFRNYALATGFDLGVINYVRLHKELNQKTFVRQPISFSAYERYQWKQELIEIFVGLSNKITREELSRNRGACNGKFGYPCEFTPICEEFTTSAREGVKAQKFTKRKEWRPW